MNAAFFWYQEEDSALAEGFFFEVRQVLVSLRAHPFRHREIRPGLRRALMRRFPYAVFYTISEAAIIVLGVIHVRRSPSSWPG